MISLVISPLKALMRDQVFALEAKGIHGAAIMKETPTDDMMGLTAKLNRTLKTYPIFWKTYVINDLKSSFCAEGCGRPNVYIHVEKKTKQNMEENLNWLMNLVSSKQELCPKTMIYCRNLFNESMFMWFKEELDEKTYFNGVETVPNRLVEMYHSRTDVKSSKRILSELKKPGSVIRVIYATVAFGIGIDIPDIEYIINWGLPSSVLTYWQELGRCGRDGRQGLSIMYPYSRSLDDPDKELKTIIKGDMYYRRQILSLFQLRGMNSNIQKAQACESNSCESCCCGQCMCCSICITKCTCSGKNNPSSELILYCKIYSITSVDLLLYTSIVIVAII
ncbi:recQ [Mytilus coruscus]|uniref:DNA 3'-5' helicase n=1 Tax=Mytilus coruscus TaxID=42192 RepID=A0A6J8BBB7_MYTCO|nr:recQ [Mytilus coruscus]